MNGGARNTGHILIGTDTVNGFAIFTRRTIVTESCPMKFSKSAPFLLVTAIVAAGSLLVASPASASTVVGNATFYDASDFGVEGSSYPTNDWFFGTISGTQGSHDFTRDGLELNADLAGPVQILSPNITTPADAYALVALIDNFEVFSNDSNWTLQLPLFGDGPGETAFTTLRPMAAGNVSSTPASDVWRTSGVLGSFAAGDTATLQELADELYTVGTPELLAYGVFVSGSGTSTILGAQWDGDTSYFLPAPTRSISATSLDTTEATTTGFTLTGTNWLPSSDVYVYIQDENGNDIFEDNFVADANGSISVPIVLDAPLLPGTLTITFDDDGVFYDVGVMGDPFITLEITAMALAATGVSQETFIVGGSAALLALMGTVLVFTSRRQMKQI